MGPRKQQRTAFQHSSRCQICKCKDVRLHMCLQWRASRCTTNQRMWPIKWLACSGSLMDYTLSKTSHMQFTITTCATELGWLCVPPFCELAQVSSQAMCFEHVQNRMTLKRDLTCRFRGRKIQCFLCHHSDERCIKKLKEWNEAQRNMPSVRASEANHADTWLCDVCFA